MLKINDIVKDKNGVLGRILDVDMENEGYEYNVLFMDVDEDGGLWLNTDKIENEADDNRLITLVDINSQEYNRYLNWEKEYSKLYEAWDKEEKWELRPSQKQLDELYSKYQQ